MSGHHLPGPTGEGDDGDGKQNANSETEELDPSLEGDPWLPPPSPFGSDGSPLSRHNRGREFHGHVVKLSLEPEVAFEQLADRLGGYAPAHRWVNELHRESERRRRR